VAAGDAGETYVVRDGEARVVLDLRAWPIVFASWFGAATEPLVDRYFVEHAKVLARARAEKTRFVLITDTFAAQRPSPVARKKIADLFGKQPGDIATLTLRSFVVIESPLIRGVVTALNWITPGMEQSTNVDSIERAIERALAELDHANVKRPAGFSAAGYRRPT
jgi:hypothetical protein